MFYTKLTILSIRYSKHRDLRAIIGKYFNAFLITSIISYNFFTYSILRHHS